MLIALLALMPVAVCAQEVPLKSRPDAFPPVQEDLCAKAVTMASTIDEMVSWDRYPTYELYVSMMQRWAEEYPTLCRLDTIGYSVQNRLILSLELGTTLADSSKPEFFYSSTIHGDEVTGYVLMLRLIDTLLGSYGISPRLTALLDRVHVCINPLANPDGTYHAGNHTVQGSIRYNANYVDLNRNFPDPFGSGAKSALPQENEYMVQYVERHRFALSANLHGGSEVMNYPWDCFTSVQNPHPQADWWRRVGKRFVDAAREVDPQRFRDVNNSGVIAGGDWYVIHGGRQDYMNYYHHCLEMTMEISTVKTLSSHLLPSYWRSMCEPFIAYIEEIYTLPGSSGVPSVPESPVRKWESVYDLPQGTSVAVFDVSGRPVASGRWPLPVVASLPAGIYIVRADGQSFKQLFFTPHTINDIQSR